MKENRYNHDEIFHHKDLSPFLMVPTLYEIFKPTSVIDIGCGIGNFLKEFKNNGVIDILGVDGSWADLIEINKNISESNFIEFNLDEEFIPTKKFDLAISLEVAEHIDANYSDNFVKTLCNCSDNVLFSAAVPLQGGQNHLNEQWNHYWKLKFEKEGFTCIDFLKPYFWDNDEIFWWYKQNIVFFTKTPENFSDYKSNSLSNVIHPDLFKIKTKELASLQQIKADYIEFLSGGMSLTFYSKVLLKKLLHKISK